MSNEQIILLVGNILQAAWIAIRETGVLRNASADAQNQYKTSLENSVRQLIEQHNAEIARRYEQLEATQTLLSLRDVRIAELEVETKDLKQQLGIANA